MAGFVNRFKALLRSGYTPDEVLAVIVMTDSEQFLSGDLGNVLERLRAVSAESLETANKKILFALSPKEESVMRRVLGIGHERMTIQKIGDYFAVNGTWISQIIERACYKPRRGQKRRRQLYSNANQELLREIGVVFP